MIIYKYNETLEIVNINKYTTGGGMSHLKAGHVEFSQEVSIFRSLYTCIVRFCVLHLTFRPVLEGWGYDRFIPLPLLDNHELVIFGMEYPSIAVRWSPSSSIISSSCCEDPLLEFSSWDTSRLSCQHWRDISSNRIGKKTPELYKVLTFVFCLFELGVHLFLKLRLFWRFRCSVSKFSSNPESFLFKASLRKSLKWKKMNGWRKKINNSKLALLKNNPFTI